MDWISVKDRLPDRGSLNWVIWHYENEDVRVLSEWDGEDWCRMQAAYEYKIYDDYAVDSFGGVVTHWQPVVLPEPPQEDD